VDVDLTTRTPINPIDVNFGCLLHVANKPLSVNFSSCWINVRPTKCRRDEQIRKPKGKAPILQLNTVKETTATTARGDHSGRIPFIDVSLSPEELDFFVGRAFITCSIYTDTFN